MIGILKKISWFFNIIARSMLWALRSGDVTCAERERVRERSGNPVIDLPSQEKNQYWTVYWGNDNALYTQWRWVVGSRWSDHKISDLSEEGGNMAGNTCGSENSGSLFRWTYYWRGGRKPKHGILFETSLSL